MCAWRSKEAFCSAMETMFKEDCRGYNTDVDVGNVLRKTLQTLRIHQVTRQQNPSLTRPSSAISAISHRHRL
eukprot:3230380-Rhodomonas_salina.1